MQLPPIRRQIITLVLKKSDIDSAIAICGMANDGTSTGNVGEDVPFDELNENSGKCKISAYYLLVM